MKFDWQGLSVVIIARNAEKTIARNLQSVATIASEVIVVINDCTDDTKHIAELYGAKVVEHEWEGFRDQKNFAISLAEHEWILSLDADEALSERLRASVREFIGTSRQYAAAEFPRRTFFLGEWVSHGDWYPDYCLRLFTKGHGRFVGGSVHEKLEIDGKICRLCGDILHYPCESLSDFTRRNIYYADMAAIDMFKRGRRISMFSAIMRSHWKFFRGYILKFGFLDKATGYYVAKIQSFLTLYKYFKLYSLSIPPNPFL
jgi:glycosyltransferase involved in cell wall biosynthesis